MAKRMSKRAEEFDRAFKDALMVAIESDNLELFELMLSKGISDEAAQWAGRRCAEAGCLKLLSRLLKVEKNWADEDYSGEILCVAAKQRDAIFHDPNTPGKMVKLLLDSGVPVDARGNDGSTALLRACNYGAISAAKALVRGGADLEARGYDSRTALLGAAADGEVKIVELLIGAGARLEACDAKGQNALMVAANNSAGGAAVAEALLSAGADMDARDAEGATAPILAVKKLNVSVLEKLIAHGMDLDQKRASDGKCLVEIAFEDNVAGFAKDWARCGEELIMAGAKIPRMAKIVVDGREKEVPFLKMVKSNGYGDSAVVIAACESQELEASTSLPKSKNGRKKPSL